MSLLRKTMWNSFWKTIGSLIGFTILIGLLIGLAVFAFYAKDLPNPGTIGQRLIAESTKIYDTTGEISLFNIHGEVKRTIIPFDEIPETAKQATIAIEDANFYNHFGVDFKGIARAILINLRQGTIREGPGGSTITQQFIKNTILTPEKALSRKIKEWILAIELERRYEKDEILSFYLNQIPYGSNAYGIESASQSYFNKHARDLTLAESAILAALPQAPTFYSPYGTHVDRLLARKDITLDRMALLGYISEEEAEEAKNEEIEFAPQRITIKAPHFVMFVREYLERTYGTALVERGGLKVITTIDMEIQTIAEEAVATGAEANKKRFNGENAAAIVIDPNNGKVRAMVGSRDYFDEEIDGNVNVTITPQQPGSSFKPFAYARAFEKGYTPDTRIFDLETNFGVQGADEYIPQNYTGDFRGPMTMREALAQSVNIPAVKTLYLAGIDETIELAERLGITTLTDRNRYGLSLVLGGGDVLPVEIASAFGVFANDGIFNPFAFIERIEDQQGNILEEFKKNERRVLDQSIVRTLNDILSDNVARTPVFGASSSLVLPDDRPVAAKTGTTQEYRDAWTIGYTPQFVTAVWVGNNDNTPMNEAPGSAAAGPIWNEIMRRILEDMPIELFPSPPTSKKSSVPMINGDLINDKTVTIDTATNRIATHETPPSRREQRRVREVHSLLYYVDPDNPLERLSGTNYDSQFEAWEKSVQQWAQQSSIRQRYNLNSYQENSSPSLQAPSIEIINPLWGDIITRSPLHINASIQSVNDIQTVEFFWDGILITTDSTFPYETFFPLSNTINGRDHVVTIRAFDRQQNKSEKEIPVIINTSSVRSSTKTAHLILLQKTPSPLLQIVMETVQGNQFNIQLQTFSIVITSAQTGEIITTLQSNPFEIDNNWTLPWNNPIPGIYRMEAILQTLGGETIISPPIIVEI